MLKGHTDIVIGLDVSYDHSLIATCSKVCFRDCLNLMRKIFSFRMI